MAKFAEKTTVDSDRTIAEIKQLLQQHGAKKFAYFEEELQAAISFEMRDRRLRFLIPLPDRQAREFWYTPTQGRQLNLLRRLENQGAIGGQALDLFYELYKSGDRATRILADEHRVALNGSVK